MKKIKYSIVSLFIIAIFLFTSCNNQKVNLLDALKKTSELKSYSYDGKIETKFNLEQPIMPGLEIDSFNIDYKGKVAYDNEENVKLFSNVKTTILDIGFDVDLFLDMNYDNDEFSSKAFIEIPEFLKAQASPYMDNIDYIHIDTDSLKEIENSSGNLTSESNINDSTEISAYEDTGKLTYEIVKSYTDINGQAMIDDTGKKEIMINGVKEELQTFRVKLRSDDLKNMFKEYLKDEAYVERFKDLLITFNEDSAFDIKNGTDIYNYYAYSFDYVGGDGILLDFAVKDGYVVYENINIYFVDQQEAITINIENKIYDINKEIEITMPNSEDNNVIDLIDLITLFNY